MGYDVHISRAESWSMNEGACITPQEWLAAVREDPELELISDSEPYVAEWVADPTDAETWFQWDKGNVYTKNPNREAILKMEELAHRLGARVRGDDDELYEGGEEVPE